MDEPNRAAPIPVRELMGHLSDDAPEPAGGPTDSGDEPGERESLEVFVPVEGVRWIAREAGAAAWGTDAEGRPVVTAVHFFRPDRDRPEREALLARGRLASMHPAELRALWERATEVPPEGAVPVRATGGRNRGGGGSGPRRRDPGRGKRRSSGKGRGSNEQTEDAR